MQIYKKLAVLRVDDLPLLYAQIQELKIQSIIDETIQPHGNWSGVSIGHLLSLWLCYLLSESKHQLSEVEDWASNNLLLLRALSGEWDLQVVDFTDDRLGSVLDYLSKPSNWAGINDLLNKRSIGVYDLDKDQTVRLDAAPMQGHHKIKKGGLFQYGYSKHHNSKLGMLKIMLASVDNVLNGFAYPLAHLTVAGNESDDVLYKPLIAECEQTFKQMEQSGRKLYTGDGKMGSIGIRYYIQESKNDYFVPLSKLQLSQSARQEAIKEVSQSSYQEVYKTNKLKKEVLVASGFERKVQVSYEYEEGKVKSWEERQLFVLSAAYAKSQQKALDTRLKKAVDQLADLLKGKQGKKKLKTRQEVEQSIAKILSNNGVKGLLQVEIAEQKHRRKLRAYGDRPARIEHSSTFELSVDLLQEAIESHKATLGWQVYATTAKSTQLDFEACVWKYRGQNKVESRFDDLRNRVVPFVPIFVEKDNRVEALVNLLMIGLNVCSVMAYKVAKKLQKLDSQLANVYPGNPKQSTATPTAKRLLKPFNNIAISMFGDPTDQAANSPLANSTNDSTNDPLKNIETATKLPLNPAIMPNSLEGDYSKERLTRPTRRYRPSEQPDYWTTPTGIGIDNINQTHLDIIELLGFKPDIYYGLIDKIKLFFLTEKISET